MAKNRRVYWDQEELAYWRRVLPGVPDDQIVKPKNEAHHHRLPTAPHFANDPERWDWLASSTRLYASMSGMNCREFSKETALTAATGSAAMKNLRKALRWWKSLRQKDVLSVQQALYGRDNGWDDIFGLWEFLACRLVVCTWLNLPRRQQSAVNIEKIIIAQLQKAARIISDERRS